jgi:hypothetical protein
MNLAGKLPLWWAPLEVRLQRLNNTHYKLQQLMQRWNNRLILEGLSFRETYLDGRITVALIMQVGGAIRRQPPTKG